MSNKKIYNGDRTPIAMMNFSSKRRARVARIIYSAETQALCNAGDALEAMKMWWCMVLNEEIVLKNVREEMMKTQSIAIVDAKGVYDNVVNLLPSKSTKSEKRTYVEIVLINEQLVATNTKLFWTDGDQNIVDGLTKVHVQRQDVVNFTRSSYSTST